MLPQAVLLRPASSAATAAQLSRRCKATGVAALLAARRPYSDSSDPANPSSPSSPSSTPSSSNSPATAADDARSPASTQQPTNGSTKHDAQDQDAAATTEPGTAAKEPLTLQNGHAGGASEPEQPRRGSTNAPQRRPPRPPHPRNRGLPPSAVAASSVIASEAVANATSARPRRQQRSPGGGGGGNKQKAQRGSRLPTAYNGDGHRRPTMAGAADDNIELRSIIWQPRAGGTSDRLRRLTQMTAAVRTGSGGEARQRGPRVGVLTRDAIMDDETWQRLKSEVDQIGRDESDAAAAKEEPEVSLKRSEGVAARWEDSRTSRTGRDEVPRKGKEEEIEKAVDGSVSLQSLETPEPAEEKEKEGRRKKRLEAEAEEQQDEKHEKADRPTVGERLRNTIGNIKSAISDTLEENSEPGRYSRKGQAATKSIDEQRIDELETLLMQAAQRLRELRGYKSSEEDAARMLGLHSPSQEATSGGQNWNEGLSRPIAARRDKKADSDEYRNGSRPVRYLSNDPNRPLPHLSEQAIPTEVYGPRKRIADAQREQQQRSPNSLVGDVLGTDPEEPQPEVDPSRDQTATPTVATPEKQAPLLNELFPELATGSQSVQKQPSVKERQVPKLSLDFQEQNMRPRQEVLSRDERVDRRMQELYVKDIVVVQLSGFSKTLVEADIRRLVPQSSKYIEGWSDPGFIKVIPVRDEITLERQDQYYVLFRDVRSARNFQTHMRKLHFTTRTHGTSSLLSTLPSPPGFQDDSGVDVHAALHSYTVGPPAADKVFCAIIPQPYPRRLHQLLARGGYERVVDSGPRTPSFADGNDAVVTAPSSASSRLAAVAKLLLWFEGPQPSLHEVRRTIARDGRDRGLQWHVVGGTNSPVGVVFLDCSDRPESSPSGADSRPRKMPSRYVVSFENKAEAHRFAARWHYSPFMFSASDEYENAEGPPTAYAEVLW